MNWSVIVNSTLLFGTIIFTLGCVLYIFRYMKTIREDILKLIHEQNESLVQFKETMVSQNYSSLTTITDAIKEGRPIDMALSEDAGTELSQIFNKIKQIAGDDLYKILMKTNACRTAIYLFHNGTRASHGGFNFIKFSCVGEKCLSGSGIKEQIFHHSNIPVNIFDDMYETLMETGRYIFIRTADGVMNTSKSKFISTSKIQYSQAVCIYDSKNIALGFILAEFDHPYDTHIANEEYEELLELCKRLKPLFSFTDYVELTTKKKL